MHTCFLVKFNLYIAIYYKYPLNQNISYYISSKKHFLCLFVLLFCSPMVIYRPCSISTFLHSTMYPSFSTEKKTKQKHRHQMMPVLLLVVVDIQEQTFAVVVDSCCCYPSSYQILFWHLYVSLRMVLSF